MTAEPGLFFETVDDQILESLWIPPARRGAPTLVFLHDGIGSVAMWRRFPQDLAAATGCAAFVFSRHGNGWSSAREAPFAVDYMHRAARDTLPRLLDQRGIEDPILIGHSDGASIALLHAGGGERPVRALILEAPHVFVEDLTIASIEAAKGAFLTTDLERKLARYHRDPRRSFFGWNDIWLHPDFRRWNIEPCLAGIGCPVLAIQGMDDEYGTLAQIDSIERGVRGPFRRVVLPGCGHTPHRDREAETRIAMAAFIAAVEGAGTGGNLAGANHE